MRKKCEKVRNMSPRPPPEEGNHFIDALRVPSSRGGEAPPKGGTVSPKCIYPPFPSLYDQPAGVRVGRRVFG